jgi:hypothetical protein
LELVENSRLFASIRGFNFPFRLIHSKFKIQNPKLRENWRDLQAVHWPGFYNPSNDPWMMSFALAPQPKHDFIVVHDIIGNQGCSIVNENHSPLQMDADFIGSPGEFAKAEAAMLMGIAKSCGYF